MIYYRGDELFAVRKGPYKAHFQTAPGYAAAGAQMTFEKHAPPLLFDLNQDPGEKNDVAAQHPEIITEIKVEVEKHRASLVPVKVQY